MADEITCTDSISINKDDVKNRGITASGIRVDQSGVGYSAGVMAVTSTPQPIPLADLTTPGRYVFQSQEDAATGTNIQIGVYDSNGFVAFDELFPTETSSGRLKEMTPYAKSTAATGKLEYFIAEA